MKTIIFAYALVVLLFTAILSVLSYGYGSGYVYIYWRDLQIQTNIWVVFALTLLTSLFIQVLWVLSKRYFTREKRKAETLFDFKSLHPYEQLGVISLLDAEVDQQQFIKTIFSNSALLEQVIASQLLYVQGQHADALTALDQTNAMAFELAEIQRIRIYLAQAEAEKALTHLEFLSQHELSPWLNDVKNAYEQTLQSLWGEYAVAFPWHYLQSTKFGHLQEERKTAWLGQLLNQYDLATVDNLNDLQQRYRDLSQNLEDKSYEVNKLWLKLLSRMPEMGEQHKILAEHLLSVQFDEDVFYLWFQQHLLKQSPDYVEIENKLNYWESKYAALPILSFVKWHVLQAQGRMEEAEQLLALYPDHVLMSYLRIKSALKDQEYLIQQLNTLFENNSNHLVIKI